MELSDQELAHISHLLDEEGSDMHHYPGDFERVQCEMHDSLSERVRNEARRRKLWWAW